MTNYTPNQVAWTVVFALEGAFIVFLNFLGLIVFRRKVRRLNSSYMLMNQCLADLLIGVRVIMFAYDDILPSKVVKVSLDYRYCGYSAVKTLAWICVVEASFGSLAIIALERAYAVFRPFKHRVLKPKHYITAIAALWSVNLVRAIALGVVRCPLKDKMPAMLITGNLIAIALIGLLIIVVSYTSIYIKMKLFSMPQATSQSQAQNRLNKTLFYATIASLLTVLPSAGIGIYRLGRGTVSIDLRYISSFIVFSNSMINFIIYSWRITGFSKDLKNALCCKKAFPMEVHPTVIELNVQSSAMG